MSTLQNSHSSTSNNSSAKDLVEKHRLLVREYQLDRQGGKYFNSRLLLLNAAAQKHNQSIADLSKRLASPMIQRDDKGFLTLNSQPLKFHSEKGQLYSSIDGIMVNEQTGTIHVMATKADISGRDALINQHDIDLVLGHGICRASFSLDPLDRHHLFDLLQEATFHPPELRDTDILDTMLSTDLLLKDLISGQEMSAVAPFQQRSTYFTLQRVDQGTRHALRPVFERKAESVKGNTVVACRSWFDCSSVEHVSSQEAIGITKYILGDCDFKVKTQLFRYRTSKDTPPRADESDYLVASGKLVELPPGDTEHEQFVKDLNANMDTLLAVFPELARLRQLHRLTALSKILLEHGNKVNATVKDKLEKTSGFALEPRSGKQAHQQVPKMIIPTAVVLGEDTNLDTPNLSPTSCKYNVGTVVDVQDDFFGFYTGEIIKVLPTTNQVFVHYDGFDSQYDEWLPTNSKRIAAKNKYTPAGCSSSGVNAAVMISPEPGTPVEIYDQPTKSWVEGIIESAEGSSIVRAHYCSDSSKVVTMDKPHNYCIRHIYATPSATWEEIAEGTAHAGQAVDALDEHYTWYTAIIIDCDAAKNSVTVKFDGWGDMWNRSIPCKLDRLAPLFTKVQGNTRTHQGPNSTIVGLKMELPPSGTLVNVLEKLGDKIKVTPAKLKEKLGDTIKVQRYSAKDNAIIPGDECIVSPHQVMMRPEQACLFKPAPQAHLDTGTLQQGEHVDVRDLYFTWHTATVQHCDPKTGVLVVSFDGWSKVWDEKLMIPSERVKLLHTHTNNSYRRVLPAFGPVILPACGSKVLVKEDNDYHEALIQSETDTEVEVKFTATSHTRRFQKPLVVGTFMELTAALAEHERVSNFTYGGIKFDTQLITTNKITEHKFFSPFVQKVMGENKNHENVIISFDNALFVMKENPHSYVSEIRRPLDSIVLNKICADDISHSGLYVKNKKESMPYIVEYMQDGKVHLYPAGNDMKRVTSDSGRVHKWKPPVQDIYVPDSMGPQEVAVIMRVIVDGRPFSTLRHNCHMAQEKTRIAIQLLVERHNGTELDAILANHYNLEETIKKLKTEIVRTHIHSILSNITNTHLY